MTPILTENGLKKIQDELNDRTKNIRQAIAKDIKEAKEQGDLSENAEYAAAKARQRENEQRIRELESILKNSKIVDTKKNGYSDRIQVGSRFKASFNGSHLEFKIVGTHEADPAQFLISNESPVGKAFLGKKQGEKVKVKTPSGDLEYEIVEIVK